MRTASAILILFACCVSGGCITSSVAEIPYVRHDPDVSNETRIGQVHASGIFRLVRLNPDGPASLATRSLRTEDAIGFEKAADGGLTAVCGNDRISIPAGTYEWRSERSEGNDAGETVIGYLLLPLAIPFQLLIILLTGSTKC